MVNFPGHAGLVGREVEVCIGAAYTNTLRGDLAGAPAA
jgi:hypothetical protein